mmetsp:Transcript_35262/g.84241  ORF Transcript_35262/g.84241 Transcript_35262/m.84241 type:complete len:266 (-) Transcript_35262:16-813(-)
MSTCKRRPQTQTPTPNEDDGLLQTKLREFDATLNKLPTSTNVSKAMSDCPDYSDAMKLVFLRCEVFNVELAVRRFVAYWETRVEVFGEHAFSSLLGLANDDHEAMKCKYTQVAERCDEAGRAILLLDYHSEGGNFSDTALLRSCWYTIHSALREESVQKKGIVIYVRTLQSIMDWRVGLCKNVISSVKGTLPVRLAGCHVIDPPLILHGVISLSKKMMGKKLGKRVYIHSGSLDKKLKSLSKFGLGRVDMYPIVFGGQLGFKSSY